MVTRQDLEAVAGPLGALYELVVDAQRGTVELDGQPLLSASGQPVPSPGPRAVLYVLARHVGEFVGDAQMKAELKAFGALVGETSSDRSAQLLRSLTRGLNEIDRDRVVNWFRTRITVKGRRIMLSADANSVVSVARDGTVHGDARRLRQLMLPGLTRELRAVDGDRYDLRLVVESLPASLVGKRLPMTMTSLESADGSSINVDLFPVDEGDLVQWWDDRRPLHVGLSLIARRIVRSDEQDMFDRILAILCGEI